MGTVRIWLVACGGIFASACMLNTIVGSGTILTVPKTVSGFSAVSLSGDGRLEIEQTGAESLTVTTDDNLLPYIKAEVRGNTLELGLNDPMANLRPTTDIIFKLSAKNLDELNVSGSGRANVKGLTQDRFHVRISGSGDVTAQGAATDLDLRISGSGGYRGDGLKSKQVTVGVSGSGTALVSASDRVDASVSGSGSVEYLGDPRLTQRISGSGSVHRR
jgi:hypothetical protein